MKIDSNILIDELIELSESATLTVQGFKKLSIEQLNYKRDTDTWSILECIEHLNLYGDYYLPAIEQSMLKQKPKHEKMIFKSGLLGNYFANLMQVKNGKMMKMKSPKDKNPNQSILSITTLDRFLKQQESLKNLLVQARSIDLTKTKVSISIAKYIKLRLGDTFRFFIYHIERHVLQAEKTRGYWRALNTTSKNEGLEKATPIKYE